MSQKTPPEEATAGGKVKCMCQSQIDKGNMKPFNWLHQTQCKSLSSDKYSCLFSSVVLHNRLKYWFRAFCWIWWTARAEIRRLGNLLVHYSTACTNGPHSTPVHPISLQIVVIWSSNEHRGMDMGCERTGLLCLIRELPGSRLGPEIGHAVSAIPGNCWDISSWTAATAFIIPSSSLCTNHQTIQCYRS
jgi:hypothetical protein